MKYNNNKIWREKEMKYWRDLNKKELEEAAQLKPS